MSAARLPLPLDPARTDADWACDLQFSTSVDGVEAPEDWSGASALLSLVHRSAEYRAEASFNLTSEGGGLVILADGVGVRVDAEAMSDRRPGLYDFQLLKLVDGRREDVLVGSVAIERGLSQIVAGEVVPGAIALTGGQGGVRVVRAANGVRVVRGGGAQGDPGDTPSDEDLRALIEPAVDELGAALGDSLAADLSAAKDGLTLSADSFDVGAALGTVIATVRGKRPGTTLLLTPNDGRLGIGGSDAAGWTIKVGVTASAVGVIDVVLSEIDPADAAKSRSVPLRIWVNKALPALPLAVGAKVIGFGHSQIQRGWFSMTGSPGGVLEHQGKSDSIVRGVLPWVKLMDTRFNADVIADPNNPFRPLVAGRDDMLSGAAQAIGGDGFQLDFATQPGFLARAAYVIARTPGVVYFHGGSNDLNSGRKAAVVIVELDAMLRQFRQAGIYVVLQTNPTRAFSAWPAGDARRDELHLLNDWIKAQAGRSGVYVSDATDLFADPPDPALLLDDGIHFSPLGAYAVAQRLLPVLQGLVSPGSFFERDPRVGNLLPGADLAGAAGTKTPAGQVTGIVPTYWQVAVNGGASLVHCTPEPDEIPGFYKLILDITPVLAPGRTSDEIRINRIAHLLLADLGLGDGDAIELMALIELSDSPLWQSVSANNSFYAGNTSRWQANSGMANPNYTADALLPRGARSLPIRTSTVIPAGRGITTLRWASGPFSIRIDPRMAGQVPPARLVFRHPAIREIANPGLAFNLPA